MTACSSEFLVADDFDVVMPITNTDILKNDTKILSEVNSAVKTYHQRRCLNNITVIFPPKFGYQNQDF